MKDTNNWQIMCASDAEEFYYEGTDELVNEGDAVGIEVDNGNSLDLVLFANIYWSDKYLS